MSWLINLPGFRLLALFAAACMAGSAIWQLQTLRYAGQIAQLEASLVAYRAQVAEAHAQLIEAQAKVVTRVEVRWRERIKVVREKGDTIIQKVPVYVTPQDTARFGVNLGFVRLYNAAFSGQSPRAATESDRDPARISLAEIADTTAFNASVCRQWKEQALGWQAFYEQLRKMQRKQGHSEFKTIRCKTPDASEDKKLVLPGC